MDSLILWVSAVIEVLEDGLNCNASTMACSSDVSMDYATTYLATVLPQYWKIVEWRFVGSEYLEMWQSKHPKKIHRLMDMLNGICEGHVVVMSWMGVECLKGDVWQQHHVWQNHVVGQQYSASRGTEGGVCMEERFGAAEREGFWMLNTVIINLEHNAAFLDVNFCFEMMYRVPASKVSKLRQESWPSKDFIHNTAICEGDKFCSKTMYQILASKELGKNPSAPDRATIC
ncbi:hypothetical protein IW261DRAFT_1680190 [Armillaria novae-zelandiae]|uniref:Uncharacterized protein n=1 Tax=Armillaria novae-zelandiae TaxID=153914 RepID=A0AA39NKX3_9AGAR|nr:hypothetical protein IW261DRAFT_1680190 [Armillaria novae-zelandiae]